MPLKNNVLSGLLAFLSPSVLLLWSVVRIVGLHSNKVYNMLNEWLFATYMRVYLFYFEYLAISKVYIYGDGEVLDNKQEKVLYMANHLSTSDWFLVSMLLARQGNIGRSRFLLHKNLKYIPVFGFYLSQASCIFVDRSNFRADKASKVLKHVRDAQSKAWLIIYPEGTRYNPEHKDVIKRSQNFAIESGHMPYRHVLTPRTRGFQLLLDNMHDYLDALYDATVIYADERGLPVDCRIRVPQMTHWFTRRHVLHIYINRIPMRQIPTEPDKVRSWLMERFRIKDEFLEKVQTTFHEPSGPTSSLADGTPTEIKNRSQNHLIDTHDYATNHNSTLNKKIENIPVEQTIARLLSPKLPKRVIQLKSLNLVELLPSLLFFYGVTFYWLLGFGWYGPLSFVLVSIFGTLAGEIYVHYAV